MALNNLLASRTVVFAILILVTFVAFGNTFRNDWTYDDIPVVVDNPDIRSLDNFSKDTYKGRPLRELSYMLDYKLFGDNPAGYHLQQNLWHAGNGCLLFLMMLALGVAPVYALLGALFFLLHPIQVESVASIGHRKELLPLFFGFLMILAYVKSLTVSGGQRWLLWLACLLSYGLVLLGNLTAVTFPFILPIYEMLFVEKDRRICTRYPFVLGSVVLATVAAGVFYYLQYFDFQSKLMEMYNLSGFTGSKGYLPLFLVALKLPVLYLGKLLWPVALAPEYVANFSNELLQWKSVAGLVLLIGLLVTFWLSRKTVPVLSFAIAWCLLLYVPVATFLPVQPYAMADRYLYMVLPGVALAAGVLLQRLDTQSLNWFFAFILVGLTSFTVIQNTYWHDNYSLWQHAVVVNPESRGALWSMGQAHLAAGEMREAKAAFTKVLEKDRFYLHAYLEIAKLEELEGNLSEAKRNYQLFVRYGQYSFPSEAMQVKAHLQRKFR